MTSTNYALPPEISQYVQSVSVREPAILRKLREETQAMKDGVMQISPEQGQFMGLLVQLIGAKHILESASSPATAA